MDLDGFAIIHPMKNDFLLQLETILLDADGVLWHGDIPMPDLRRFFDVLKRSNIRYAVVTNNATKSRHAYASKFLNFGIDFPADLIFSSSVVTAELLKDEYPTGAGIFVVGEQGIREAIGQAGFRLLDENARPDECSAVVAGLDRAINYPKIAAASRLIRGGAAYFGTNGDATFPGPEGLEPGAGAVLAAITAASGIEPRVMGKPGPAIFLSAVKYLDANPATTAVVGDRLETDILGGKKAGINTILVMSGVTTLEMLTNSDIHPDLVFGDIVEIADTLEKVSPAL
jgi:4-nitrophenyl phosphatase